MLRLPRSSQWTWSRGSQLGVLLVLLLLGHLGVMAISSHAMGEDGTTQVVSELQSAPTVSSVAASPMSCPGGAGNCMLAWARPNAETTTTGVVAPLVVSGLHVVLAGGHSLAPSTYALSPPRYASVQVLLQVFRL